MRKELIAHRNPKSPNSEIFRTLRTNIQFMNTNKKLKTLLVTSTFPGEGKSWVASNLAVTFAQAGKRVILIDADMRKGRIYSIFGVSPKPGLSNFLAETEVDENGKSTKNIGDYIQETEVENLYIVAAGSVPPNPSELLVSAQMIKLLDDLKELCDLVIIDGTPCELVADSIILSRIVDSCIIITAHKMTKKDALERVIKNIQNVGGKLAGVVINRVPTNKGYSSRYYYYGSNRTNENKNNNFREAISKDLFPRTKNNNNIEENIATLHKEMEENQEKIQQKIFEQNDVVTEQNEEPENDTNIEQTNYQENEMPEAIQENEMPEAIQENSDTQTNNDKSFEEKTNEIIQQINDYINKEKNNL